MQDKVRIALRDLVADKGESLLASSELVRGLLSDDCPECTEEINVLTTAVDAQVPSELRDYSTAAETRVALNASILRLERGLGLGRPAAAWAVVTLANVLNHIPDDQFPSLLVELGGEPSLPSAPETKRPRPPMPSAPPLSSTPPPTSTPPATPPPRSSWQTSLTPPPAATPHPPPPPRPRRAPPPPRPAPPQSFSNVNRAAAKPQDQSSRFGKILGIVAVAVLGSWIAIALIESQSQTPEAQRATSPPSQTQPAGSGPVTSPPPEPQPPGTQPTPSAAVPGDAPGPKLISHVAPVYPPLAKQAGIQGAVAFKAVIATDGTVKSLELLRGHPLLVPAAQAAVKQWRYEPTVLNGVPVEVVTQIEVNFTLSQ